jgi:IPT/TIG domain-containing protein
VSLIPSTAGPGDTVALFGAGFGNAKADDMTAPANPDSAVLVGGLKTSTVFWADGRIDFTVPARSPDGNAWHGTEVVQVSVVISGTPSYNTLVLSVVARA